MSTLVLAVFCGLFGVLYVGIGVRAARSVQSLDDYYLMGRSLSVFPLTLTLLATQLGGGFLLGAAQEAYTRGWQVLLYPAGGALGLIILGLGFGAKLRRLNLSTVAEIFAVKYRSKRLHLLASLLSIVSFYFILVGQGIAARKFFLAIGGGEGIFLLFWLAFVAYTVMGGLKAVVDTDIIQVVFILVGLCLAWYSIDWSLPSLDSLPALESAPVDELPWSSWLLMPLLFMLIEQDMGQRCFAARDPSAVRPSAILAGVLLFGSSVVAIGFGVLARSLSLSQDEGSVLIEAVSILTTPWVSALFMAVVLMAIASSADSILCSIGSNLSCDILSSMGASAERQMRWGRALTLATGLGALGTVYVCDNVVSVLIFSYELSVCALFVPVMAALLLPRPSLSGATLSIAAGATGLLLFRVYEPPFPREVLTLLLSAASYTVGAVFAKRWEVRRA